MHAHACLRMQSQHVAGYGIVKGCPALLAQAPQMAGHDAHAAAAFAQAHGLSPEQVLAFQQHHAVAQQQQQHGMPLVDAAQLHAMHAGQVGALLPSFHVMSNISPPHILL